jgi:hypothetical protein
MHISCLAVCGTFSLPGHRIPDKIFSGIDWRLRGSGKLGFAAAKRGRQRDC